MNIRERIIEYSTSLFLQYGIQNVTMDAIAVDLGMSKRTVYENFKDKTGLVDRCIDYLFEEQEKMISNVLAGSENVIEIFTVFMKEGMKAMNSINPVFFADMKKFYPLIWREAHRRKLERSLSLIETLLRQGIDQQLFRKEIDVLIVAKLFHEQNNMIVNEEVFPPGQYNISDIFQNLTVNFMRGISTMKGIETIETLMK